MFPRAFLELPHSIPANDILGRVFAALDSTAFEAALLGWAQALAAIPGQVVAIDGETLRHSHDRANGKSPRPPAPFSTGAGCGGAAGSSSACGTPRACRYLR